MLGPGTRPRPKAPALPAPAGLESGSWGETSPLPRPGSPSGRVSFPALPACPLTRSPPRPVLPGPAQVRLKVLGAVGYLPSVPGGKVNFGSLGHTEGRELRPLSVPEPRVSVLADAGWQLCWGSGRGCVWGRVGEPLALLGLIENRNMLKFSFVLGWGLGSMPFSIHFYSIMPLRLPFGSVLCPHVTENFVLKCVFLLNNCFQLLLYWAWGSVVLRSFSKTKSDVGIT